MACRHLQSAVRDQYRRFLVFLRYHRESLLQSSLIFSELLPQTVHCHEFLELTHAKLALHEELHLLQTEECLVLTENLT